jgi:hypothetical protein
VVVKWRLSSPRKAAFVFPISPAPRTAVLVPWFRQGTFSRAIRSNPIRIFEHGWCSEAAAFQPAAIAATYAQLEALMTGAVSPPIQPFIGKSGNSWLTHAVIVLLKPRDALLAEEQRERLWRAFRVPVFQQIIGNSGELLAAECEVHDGLHIVSPRFKTQREAVSREPCPCGRQTPRVGVVQQPDPEPLILSGAK